jgi:diguanylate cyclase (GGDEF)-like protein
MTLSMIRAKAAVPLLVAILGVAAIAAILLLQQHAVASDDREDALQQIKIEINQLGNVPFLANDKTGGNAERAGKQLRAGKRAIQNGLAELRRDDPPAPLADIPQPLAAYFSGLDRIYEIGASGQDYGPEADRLAAAGQGQREIAGKHLDAANRIYDQRAQKAIRQAGIGTAAAILLLLGAFNLFYRRYNRLLDVTRKEALTDALTGLPNRRALIADLDCDVPAPGSGRELVLALFDLDGFKQYNDTFGHAAGDALLARLGERLRAGVAGLATPYRMGGDEFCLLAEVDTGGGEELVWLAASALSDQGDKFEIGCSYGVARLPADGATAAEALVLTDQRMYEHKAGRTNAGRQSTDLLLTVLSDRDPLPQEHGADVADLARKTAAQLGLPEQEAQRIALAAELHDIGKTAIPDSILRKRGPLDEDEWDFMRRHAAIGERIVRAAPALVQTAELVRSSHERYDGTGYPDGLAGAAIPRGAAILAVCDAYDAMVSERPYRERLGGEAALAELRKCAGGQFDPAVVEAFATVVAARLSPR